MITCTHLTLPQAQKTITWGVHATPFGTCLIGLIKHGICHLSFFDEDQPSTLLALERLEQNWSGAQFNYDQKTTQKIAHDIFSKNKTEQHLILQGTTFQIKVWEALLTIPLGSTVSYQEIAIKIGNPKGHRAAATALAKNNIAYLIPCHRVIKKCGATHNYRWGADRKKMMLNFETK